MDCIQRFRTSLFFPLPTKVLLSPSNLSHLARRWRRWRYPAVAILHMLSLCRSLGKTDSALSRPANITEARTSERLPRLPTSPASLPRAALLSCVRVHENVCERPFTVVYVAIELGQKSLFII